MAVTSKERGSPTTNVTSGLRLSLLMSLELLLRDDIRDTGQSLCKHAMLVIQRGRLRERPDLRHVLLSSARSEMARRGHSTLGKCQITEEHI